MIRRAWFLNLDRDSARRAAMEATLAAAGLDYERFPALGPDEIPEALLARFRRPGVLRPGEIGCFASHLAALGRIAAEAPGWYAVFEDDVALAGDVAALGRALAALPAGVEAVRLENPPKCGSLRVAEAEGFAFLRPLDVPNSSAGYLVTPGGARAIRDAAREVDIAYDQFLRAIGRDRVDMLICAPSPLVHLDLVSAIDPEGARRRGRKRRYSFRGAAPTPARLWRRVARFGVRDFVRVVAATWAMRLARVKVDRDLAYAVRSGRAAA